MDRPCISGALIVDQRRSLTELLGAEAYARLLGAVSARTREMYEMALGVSWVPVGVVEEVVTEASRQTGRPLLELHANLTRRNMARTLNGMWRVLLRVTTDRALIERAPVFWRKSFDTGYLESHISEPGRASIRLRDWADISEIHLVGLQVGIEAILTAAGRREVQLERRRTPGGAALEAKWAR